MGLGINRKKHENKEKNQLIDELVEAEKRLAALELERLQNEKIRQQLERLDALRAVDRAARRSMDLSHTLEYLLGQLTQEMEIDASDVLLFNQETERLEYAAARGFRTSLIEDTQRKIGEGYAGRVAAERQTLRIHDLTSTEASFGRADMAQREHFSSYVGVPLVVSDQVKGVLEVFQRTAPERDEEWFDFLQALAGRASLAIENAELFNALKQSDLAQDDTLQALIGALQQSEGDEHTKRVAELSVALVWKAWLSRGHTGRPVLSELLDEMDESHLESLKARFEMILEILEEGLAARRLNDPRL